MQENFPNYYKIIANNVKKLRFENGLSQEKFAEMLLCSREFISRLENYHERISLQMLLDIARIFNVNPEAFFKF